MSILMIRTTQENINRFYKKRDRNTW